MIEMTAATARFLSPEPEVKLVNSFARPFDNAMATARTCYSGKGIVTAEQVAALDERDAARRAARLKKRDELAASLFQAGHHTVFQHAHFQFAISNVSRHFVWNFLHSHPFYNSEQVSQRYVEVRPGACAVPPLAGEALTVFRQTISWQFDAYRRLIDLLFPVARAEFFVRFRARARTPQLYEKEVRKRCAEVARYVLPVATFACLYHTVSGITLLRYHRLMNLFDTPLEQRIVVGRMVGELLRCAPEYRVILSEPIPFEATVEYQFLQERERADEQLVMPIEGARRQPPRWERARQFREEFDRELGGRVSKLVDFKSQNEKILADAVREVFGLTRHDLSDDEAIEWVMNPARNRYLGDEMNLTAHTKLTRAMVHAHYTFRKKLSHSADSQDQRHRLTPASRPALSAYLTDEPDFITPLLLKLPGAEAANKLYRDTMELTWKSIRKLRSLGVRKEFAAYLLPNAVSIRFTESSDLAALWHKHAMRLCYNAQEEIWRASVDEAEQIRAVNPRIGRYLLPPCGLRDLAGRR
ncbi:MAG: FAD-dependent thymidylate synthase, partial [Verrucomicrobiae bacterium]|nr:FAD-dependent thymidylate synthase [Verrucomicrobiae bacterium]